ncbi:BTAD domain-containing putative transcriptional regulator [Streptomyces sp. NBS 14/10]|nr:BTAD domain-containing putative transcriptional regulator [Streptomyces sp. NBS 14/10]KAK1183936.1 BTAD domain-containing putative transcriptional regulator [Streptomyces sp. NBS 14/10]
MCGAGQGKAAGQGKGGRRGERETVAHLELGRHAEAVLELTALITEHPVRERLRALLMLALYRSGRQAEALGVYTDTNMWQQDNRYGSRPMLRGTQARSVEWTCRQRVNLSREKGNSKPMLRSAVPASPQEIWLPPAMR